MELEVEANTKYGILPSVHRLNSVLLAYVKVGKVNEAEHFIKEMREKLGVLPDKVSYTTLIQGYREANNLERCWEIYYECSKKLKPGRDIDEQMIGYMRRVCAATHSIIMACASTYRFAPKAIEYWHLMHAKNIMPD